MSIWTEMMKVKPEDEEFFLKMFKDAEDKSQALIRKAKKLKNTGLTNDEVIAQLKLDKGETELFKPEDRDDQPMHILEEEYNRYQHWLYVREQLGD